MSLTDQSDHTVVMMEIWYKFIIFMTSIMETYYEEMQPLTWQNIQRFSSDECVGLYSKEMNHIYHMWWTVLIGSSGLSCQVSYL